MEIVIITGISGAGKTSVINICQDNDYYAIDNLSPKFILQFLESIDKTKPANQKFAFVTDVRVGDEIGDLGVIIEKLKNKKHDVKTIFIDASNEEIIRRFQEKRRPHFYKHLNLESAIKLERKKMEEIKSISEFYIDTTSKNLPQLKNRLLDILAISAESSIQIISFGFKYGVLREADYIFDVRFIDNPYYVEEIKNKNGTQKEIIDYVTKFEATNIFVDKIYDLIKFLVPNFKSLGKNNIVIGIGCTGGKHRSVVISEMIYNKLKDEYSSSIYHREKDLW